MFLKKIIFFFIFCNLFKNVYPISRNKENDIKIQEIKLIHIFSAQYKYYSQNPIGSITLKNNSQKTIKSIYCKVMIKDYMDFPTESKGESTLKPGETIKIELKMIKLNICLDTRYLLMPSCRFYKSLIERFLNFNFIS